MKKQRNKNGATRFIIIVALALLTLNIGGCGNSSGKGVAPPQPPLPPTPRVNLATIGNKNLVAFESCDDFREKEREHSIKEMEAHLEVINVRCRSISGGGGYAGNGGRGRGGEEGIAMAASGESDGSDAGSAESPPTFTDTNI